MGMDPITIMAVAAAVGTGASIYSGMEQKKAADNASRQAQANADKMASEADQATNRANQKRPDTAAILGAAQQAGRAGASGTMLTGPTGVDPSTLQLGKNTLLGM